MYVKPWSSESLGVLQQLSISGRAYTTNMPFVRKFASQKPIRELINNDFLDISHNHKKKRSVFTVRPDIMVIPKPGERGMNFHFRRFKVL